MATLGQYAKAQTATGAAADSSLQALMLLMQHMAQREDRKADREYQRLQMDALRLSLGRQETADKEARPGVSTIRNINDVLTTTPFTNIMQRSKGLSMVLDSPYDQTLLTEYPHAASIVVRGKASELGLEKDTWSQEFGYMHREIDRLEDDLGRNQNLSKVDIENLVNRMRAQVGEDLGLNGDNRQLASQALGQSLVVAELNNGMNHKEITLDYLRGKYPQYEKALKLIGGSTRGWSDVIGGGLRQTVGGSLEEIIKRTPDHGLTDETIEQLTSAPADDRHDLLNRINAEGATNVLEGIASEQPPPEPGFWDKAGDVVTDVAAPLTLAAIAARGTAVGQLIKDLPTWGRLYGGEAASKLAGKVAIPTLIADLGAKGGVKTAELAMRLMAEDEEELEQGLDVLGQHTGDVEKGILGLWAGAKAMKDIAGGALSEEVVGLPLSQLETIAQYADPEFKAAREAGIREELGKLEGRDLSETEKNQQKDLQESLNTDVFDEWLHRANQAVLATDDQLRQTTPLAPGYRALQHDSDKQHEDIKTVLNIAQENFRAKEMIREEEARVGPPAPPWQLPPPRSYENMSLEDMFWQQGGEELGPQGTPYGPLRSELGLPGPALEPEMRESDPLMDFLGISQGPNFAMDSPAPYAQEVAPPLSDTVPTSGGQYAGGYPEALQIIQEMALQQAPSLEMMMQASPPVPSAPGLPPGYTTMAPSQNVPQGPPQGLPPELMLQLIMMQAQMAQAGQSPLSVGSPPVPQGY